MVLVIMGLLFILGTAESRVTAILLIVERLIEGQKLTLESGRQEQNLSSTRNDSDAGAAVGRSKRSRRLPISRNSEGRLTSPPTKRTKLTNTQSKANLPSITNATRTPSTCQTQNIERKVLSISPEQLFVRHAVTMT